MVLGARLGFSRGAVELFDRVGKIGVGLGERASGFDAVVGVPLRFEDASELPANRVAGALREQADERVG
jgi:hypothetical protein